MKATPLKLNPPLFPISWPAERGLPWLVRKKSEQIRVTTLLPTPNWVLRCSEFRIFRGPWVDPFLLGSGHGTVGKCAGPKWSNMGSKIRTGFYRERAEYCFESTVSEERTHWVLRQTRWVLPKTRWVRFCTQIIGWKELTEFRGANSVSRKKLTEFRVWNRTPRNRIRPVSDFSIRETKMDQNGPFWSILA